MNSQLKDALSDFINRNSVAIEQAMENTNCAKDEPLIQDLVNYLSGTKDSQTMPMDDRACVQHNLTCESNLELTQLVHVKSSQPVNNSEGIQSRLGHACGSGREANLNVDTRLHQLMQDQEHPQFQQHHDSYGQNSSLFSYSLNQNSCADNIPDVNLSSSTFDRPRDHLSNETGVSSLCVANEAQYNYNEDSVQFHFASGRQYIHSQKTQFPNTENSTGQFQNISFKDSPSFTSSASSEMPYSTTQDNHGYSLMGVIHASVNNMDSSGSQVKVPEKMQTDEPEAIFKQATDATSSGQYHIVQMQTLDAHLQSYSSGSFNLLSALDNAHGSVPSNKDLNGCGLEQNLNNTVESQSSADSKAAAVGTAHTSTAFDLHINTCESFLSNSFTSQTFQENITEPTPSSAEASAVHFQEQSSPCQGSSVISNRTSICQRSASTGFSALSSLNTTSFNHNSSYLSPYQSSQYQDPAVHSSSSIPDGLKISSANSTSPLAILSPNRQLYHHNNFDSPSYQHPPSSHQSSSVSLDQYQQQSTVGSDYAGNASIVHSLDQHVMAYQDNTASPMNISVPFSETTRADDLNQQQHLYVTSSSAQANESSYFMNCTSATTDVASFNQICSSQNITEYTRLESSNSMQSLADSNNSPTDVTMRELPVEGHIHSFSSLGLRSVVDNFGTQGSASIASQNNCSGTSLLTFSQASNPVVGGNLNLDHQSQAVETMSSYIPSSSVTTLTSETRGQQSVPQFGTSHFDLSSASQVADLHLSSQMSMTSFPQPMQVQNSEFLSMAGSFSHCSSATNEKINTETSMDTSSDLGANRDGTSHRISFEEIHMSIVNAGDILAQESCGTSVEQARLCKSAHSQVAKSEPAGCVSGILSFRDLGTFHSEASQIDNAVCSNMTSDDARLKSAVSISESSTLHSSENVSLSGSFNSDANTTYILTNSSSAPAALPNLNADHSLLQNILNSTQTPTTSNQLQDQITNQASVTVPNFLHSAVSGNITSSKDHQSLMPSQDVAEGHQQIHFVVTTTSDTPFNFGPTVCSSGNQFSGASMVTDGTARNLLQSLSFLSQSRPGLGDKTTKNSLSLQANQDNPTMRMNLAETTVSDSTPFSDTSLQLASSVTFSNTLKDAVVLEDDAVNASSDSLNGMTSHGISARHSSARGNVHPGATEVPNTPPHIVMSLDDLQELILQQKSHSSSPVLHQLSHSATSPPQTLVIQKHASHSLRQSQPRLTIKGMTLSSSSRVTNPHQQGLHARDRTQLLVHKTQQSEHTSDTEATSKITPEHAIVFTDQESQHKFASSTFQTPLLNQTDQQHAQPKPTEQQSLPKIQLQLKQAEAYHQQQQQQAVNDFLKEIPKPNDGKLPQLQLVSQQHLVLVPGQQQAHTDQTHAQMDPPSQQQVHNVIQLALNREEPKELQKQDSAQRMDGQLKRSFLQQLQEHLQSVEQPERRDRSCNDSLKNEYRHLHSLLTGETTAGLCQAASMIAKAPPSSEAKVSDVDMDTILSHSESAQSQSMHKVDDPSSTNSESHTARDSSSNRQASLLAQILTERKRYYAPLSVSLHSPNNSNSEAGSPLSSPTFDDGNTQLTLIERSASLQIKSDHLQSMDDGDDDENAIFDLNVFHKRPSFDEFHSIREKSENVPMKIAKPSVNADAHTSINLPSSPEEKFDFGSAVSSASNFSFAFGNKDRNSSGMFTFGSSGAVLPTNDSQQYKDGSNPNRPSCSKPLAKAVAMRSALPTQPVRPISRRQKDYSLKACYPSKVDVMELKILAQPEPQHRARYQTEGSRGAIKDESQQGYPKIKLFGYSKATKLQVYIGDEGGRVKPHGFYQACRVSGKNSTPCVEQEIEGTTVLEVDLLPENNMTVKLDCIGILKLRNADVERRIGPKRARDKKRTNTRARLVMRCSVEKSDGRQYFLQVASNPIVCTQPVGQPEISRMSLSECSVHGGDSLFIIGKNFKNKGTIVLFQTLDPTDDYVTWQAEAEIEQEFFQPTHLICKIPPYKDKALKTMQEAQIVVSCAGKMSDPHSFIYKPVYQMVSCVKQEALMETDITAAARPLSFVSPEALHLNRLVQEAHAQSSATSLFQLPADTFSDTHTAIVKSPPAATTFKGLRPAILTNLTPNKSEVSTVPVCVTVESSASTPVLPASSTSVSFASESSKSSLAGRLLHLTQPSSVFGEKYNCNGFVQKLSGPPLITLAVSSSSTNSVPVKGIVHSMISPIQPAISKTHPELSLVSATGAGPNVARPTIGHKDLPSTVEGPTIGHMDLPSAVAGPTIGHKDLPSTVEGPTVGHKDLPSTVGGPTVGHKDLPSTGASSLPSAPFFLVVDPAVFQSTTRDDKIQQLLLQILEAQTKLI